MFTEPERTLQSMIYHNKKIFAILRVNWVKWFFVSLKSKELKSWVYNESKNLVHCSILWMAHKCSFFCIIFFSLKRAHIHNGVPIILLTMQCFMNICFMLEGYSNVKFLSCAPVAYCLAFFYYLFMCACERAFVYFVIKYIVFLSLNITHATTFTSGLVF